MGALPSSQRDQKVAELLPIVRRIARRVVRGLPSSVDIDDLISVGSIAAVKCADAFDPTQEASWKGYVGTRIHGAMIDYMREVDPVSRSVRDRAKRLREAREDIQRKQGRKATRLEIADRLGIGTDDLDHFESMAIEHRLLSLDTPINDGDSETTIGDGLADKSDNSESWFNQRALLQILKRLPEREARIVELYILGGQNHREIGEMLGVSEARISQIIARATRRIEQNRSDLYTKEEHRLITRPKGIVPKPARSPKPSPPQVVVAPAAVLPPPPPATAADLRQELVALRLRLSPPDPASLLREQLRRHTAHLRAVSSP